MPLPGIQLEETKACVYMNTCRQMIVAQLMLIPTRDNIKCLSISEGKTECIISIQ